MTRRRALAAAALFLFVGLGAERGRAHNLAPAYLELRELAAGSVAVHWKTSALVPRGARFAPQLPCSERGPRHLQASADALVLDWQIVCAGSLVGQRVAVAGLPGSGTDALLRVVLRDGREIRAILRADAPSLVIPARESAIRVFASYARLGAGHLAAGLDHVLFAAGLTLLLGATRRLGVGITAFTAGHSATLALAALGAIHVPQAPVELAIAASIVLLARELARDAGAPSALRTRFAALPFAFGLLHGLGFAGALTALGLPAHAIPLALFSFNLGIELGQLALVAGLLAALAPLRALAAGRIANSRILAELPASAIGGLGAFWCLERAATLLAP